MISLMHAFSRNFLMFTVKGSFTAFIIFNAPLLYFVDALALPNEDTLHPSIMLPPESQYLNYAQKGSYENETWFSEVPQWHYYDMFGNKLIDGFYLYGLSMNRNTLGSGTGNLALHPFLRMWFNGLVQVADLHDNGGIMVMVGDRVKSQFTPFSFNQTLFGGARFDVYYKQNSLSLLTNRISNTGTFGVVLNQNTATPTADWLTGGHAKRKFGEVADVGGTYVNIHHEESKNWGNPFSGVDSDTLTKKTPTGLSLYGLNFNLNLNNKVKAYAEYLKSQEYLDGSFLPKGGAVATLNGNWDLSEKLRFGGEFYSIGSRFQTNFSCPAHPYGDGIELEPGYVYQEYGKYQYSLVEDNDDKDEFPENGRSKYLYYTQQEFQGDPDGVIPTYYDKDKNGVWDYQEEFLMFDADPPESKILFDRNNNGTADVLEDDPYPDYPYVPSYYLPNERYYRFDEMDDKWEYKWADSMTHKGLAGVHLYGRFELLPNLAITVGGIFDKSQEKTFQTIYDTNRVAMGDTFGDEKASDIYVLAHYKKELAEDKYLMIDNLFRKIQDNIPNHTTEFYIDPGTEAVSYYLIQDKLDYRDMFGDALRAEFTLFRNRGFNFTSAEKFEFQKHTPHLEFNYSDMSISSLTLLNKCHYIYLLPFSKDLFLIPKYQNYWEIKSYGPRPDTLVDAELDAKFRRNAMINAASMVCEWKITEKTALTSGLQLKKFDDFHDMVEGYWEPCFRIQLMIKDRYAGVVLILTTGFSRYSYLYNNKEIMHNPLNNPHRVVKNIDAHDIFIKLHCGF